MKSLPLVSVIIPCYNGASFLPAALNSLRKQNYPALEIIVVNDGSTDTTATVAKSFGDKIIYLEQENLGPAIAKNAGLAIASGSLISFLDVDDLWPEGRLLLMLEPLSTSTQVVMGQVQWQWLQNNPEDQELMQHFAEPAIGSYVPACLFRRELFQSLGNFDGDLWHGEDVDFFNRMVEQQVSMRIIPNIVYYYQRHSTNMTLGKDVISKRFTAVLKKAINRRRQMPEQQYPTTSEYLQNALIDRAMHR